MKQIKDLIPTQQVATRPQVGTTLPVRPHSLPSLEPKYLEKMDPANRTVFNYMHATSDNKKVSDMTIEEKAKLAKDIVVYGKRMLNLSKVDVDTIDENSIETLRLYIESIEEFGMLTKNEIAYVMKKGFRGEYADDNFVHLSPSYISRWLKSYKDGIRAETEKRALQLQHKQQQEEESNVLLSEEEQLKGLAEVVNGHVSQYMRDEMFKAVAVSVFVDELVRRGVMPQPTVEEKKAAYEMAKKNSAKAILENPKMQPATHERLVLDAKAILYNNFIKWMGDNWKELNDKCEIIDMEI